jgi:tetratricopeptide (TPR) repeat protein
MRQVLAMVFAVALAAGTALAGSIEEADGYFNQGQAAFDKGDYQGALDLFTKAYSTYPNAKYVFKIASCYEKLGNLPRALDAYEMFTQYDPTPEVLQRVEEETKRLKDKLAEEYAEVYVFTSPEGAQIIVDEISKQNVYVTPTRRWLKEGEHSIFFKKDGCLPREMKVTVKRGEHLFIYAGLKPEK